MDEHREEREELAAIQADIFEPDDEERELAMDIFWDERAQTGLLWVRQ